MDLEKRTYHPESIGHLGRAAEGGTERSRPLDQKE